MRTTLAPTIALLMIATLAIGCGSDTTKTPTTTTDTSAGSDAITTADGAGADGAGTDAVNGDTTAATDAGKTDAGTTDAGTTDAGTTDAGPTAKYTTCSAVGDCVSAACAANAKDCEKPCLADASADALQKAVPLLSCYQSKCVLGACKDSKEPKCAADCMTQQCIGDFIKCIDTPAVGAAACGTSFDCFDACDLNKGAGFACYSTCIDALTADDTKLLGDVGVCMAANPGKKPDEACGKEMFACMVGSKSGDKACFSVFKCSTDCQKDGKSEDACMVACLGGLTKAAQGAFIGLAPCLGDDKKMTSDPKCQAALKTCLDPKGTATCAATFTCASKCPGGNDDPSCMFECLHDSSSAAYDTFLEISACNPPGDVTPTSPPGDVTPTNSGPSEACLKSMVTCAAPSGKGDCVALFGCFQTCQKSLKEDNPMACMFQCATTGTTQAYADLIALGLCSDKCEDTCAGKGDACENTCMSQDCPAALKACSPPN